MGKTYFHEKRISEPIVLMTFGVDYNIKTDVQESTKAGLDLLNSLSEPVFYIVDLRALDISLNLLIHGAAQAALDPQSVYRHPMIRELLFVAGEQREIFQLAAEGLNSEIYGYIRGRAFATLEEALSYVRCQESEA